MRRSTLRVSGSARHNKAALALTMKSDVLGDGRYFVAQSPKEKLMKFRVMAIVFAVTLALGTSPPSITRSGPRPRFFTAYLPGRRLSIFVTSNASRARVERVGRGILAAAARGK